MTATAEIVAELSVQSDGDSAFWHASRTWRILISAATFVSGIAYVVLQWRVLGETRDSLFVSLLFGSTGLLVLGIRRLDRHLRNRGRAFYTFVLAAKNPEEAALRQAALHRKVFDNRRLCVVGFIYGALIGLAPLYLGVWSAHPALKWSLALFLFCVNYAAGIALCGLVAFLLEAIKMGEMVVVDIWETDNPSTEFLLSATRRIAVVSSAYICLSMCSLLFSVIPLGLPVLFYAGFATLTLLAALSIPPVPIARKLRVAKRTALREVDQQVQIAFTRTLGVLKTGNSADLAAFESLLSLRQRIVDADTYPFRAKSFIAAVSVIGFSSVPVVLDQILRKFFS